MARTFPARPAPRRRRHVAAVAYMVAMTAALGSGLISATLPARADTAMFGEFNVPTEFASPAGIVKGPDGNLWFTEENGQQVARITPRGVITEWPVQGFPQGITVGSDANLWFREDGGFIGRITPQGTLTEFSVPSVDYSAVSYGGIAPGPDGNIWYTVRRPMAIGRITPTGQVQELSLVGLTQSSDGPSDITAGPDGNLWFGYTNNPFIGRISPTFTNYTELTLPPPGPPFTAGQSWIHAITTGPDGNLWYTRGNNKVGRLTPTGVFTEFAIPTSGSNPGDIATGPDGKLWFTENVGNRLGEVSLTGEIHEFLLPHGASGPSGITAGPDHKVWFTEYDGNRIGNIDPATATPPPPPCLVISHSTRLTQDVGPCAGDGIVVTGANVVLNMNGHRVFSAPGRRVGDFVGVHLIDARAAIVINGEITGFDAGVAVEGGANNTITRLSVHDNLSPADQASNFGDGIVVFGSAGNRIDHNSVVRNGVFDGIGVLGLGSNRNTVSNNVVEKTTALGSQGGFNPGSGSGIIVDAFLVIQGGFISQNNVINNVVRDNVGSGISNVSNVDAQIRHNQIAHNGFNPDGSGNRPGNGIGISTNTNSEKMTRDTVSDNDINDNFGSGVEILTGANTVTQNRAAGNRFAGILGSFSGFAVNNLVNQNRVSGSQYGIFNGFGATSNTYLTNTATADQIFDLFDAYPDCDHNVWSDNTYGTASPVCTTARGHQVTGPGPVAGQAAAQVEMPKRGLEQFARGKSVTGEWPLTTRR